MSRPHPPAHARSLVAQVKQGGDPAVLIAEARTIPDPYHAAWALWGVSADTRLPAPAAQSALGDVLAFVEKVPEAWRRAELIAELAPRSSSWRAGESTTQRSRDGLPSAWVAAVRALPAGAPRSVGIQGVAKAIPRNLLPALLDLAIENTDHALEDGKAVLGAWCDAGPVTASEETALQQTLARAVDRVLAGRLWGHMHHKASKLGLKLGMDPLAIALQLAATLRPDVALELLRSLIQSSVSVASLRLIHTCLPAEKVTACRVLSALGARSDQLGDQALAAEFLNEGVTRAAEITDPKAKEGVLRNLQQGLERLGPTRDSSVQPPSPKPTPETPGFGDDDPDDAPQTPVEPSVVAHRAKPAPQSPSTRPLLAIHNGYDGGLKAAHTQAVARAAPLCVAFDLDLVLVGFPSPSAAELVAVIDRETRIGEGSGPVRQLLDEGRLLWVPADVHHRPHEWKIDAEIVAMTQNPDAAKATDLRAMVAGSRRVCLVMGLGHRGLPQQLLRAATHHYELTGSGVPLETATVMGVVAERLRALRA